MNKEEAIKLAPGSIILVEAIAKCVEDNGVVAVSLHGDNRWHNYAFDHVYAKPEMPKYDPRRSFREGDMVRYRERDGRKIFRLQDGAIYEVKRDESAFGTVEVWLYEHERFEVYPYSIFELVTPAELADSYGVRYNVGKECAEVYHRRSKIAVAVFRCTSDTSREEAEECAEAEAERRNKKLRKEGNNE